jgi:hypothetical protein
LQSAAGGLIRIVTGTQLPNALNFINQAAPVDGSIGHHAATREQINAAKSAQVQPCQLILAMERTPSCPGT